MTEAYDEELRARLTRLDPTAAESAVPATSPRAQELLESVMETPTKSRRPAVLAAAAAVAMLAVAAGAVLAVRDGGGPEPARQPTELRLAMPDPTVMSSCVQVDAKILADMPVAFAGTVVEVTEADVTLDPTRWYAGTPADRVTLAVPPGGNSVALDGVEFHAGGDYLVAATDGRVNGCGFSGPKSAELERLYAEAYGG